MRLEIQESVWVQIEKNGIQHITKLVSSSTGSGSVMFSMMLCAIGESSNGRLEYVNAEAYLAILVLGIAT